MSQTASDSLFSMVVDPKQQLENENDVGHRKLLIRHNRLTPELHADWIAVDEGVGEGV